MSRSTAREIFEFGNIFLVVNDDGNHCRHKECGGKLAVPDWMIADKTTHQLSNGADEESYGEG